MTSAPEITIQRFTGTQEDFDRFAREFSSTNSQYRGYDKLVELVSSLPFDQHDLYEARSDGEMAGVAAVVSEGTVLLFNVFAVSEGFREIGVGDALFNEIVNDERYGDAKTYESMALPGDRSTKNFFEQRQGKARLLIVGGPIVRNK